jgi:hydrogenase expression/formation protein HypC
MCLTVPGRIVAITADPVAPVAEVDYDGVRRQAQLLYLPDARVGEYVLVQAGFAIRRLSDDEAHEALALVEGAVRAAGRATA